MTAHVLDNPVWRSLATVHRGLARGDHALARYPADVAPFLAIPAAGPVAAAALDALVGDDTVLMIGPRPAVPAGWLLGDLGAILQMVCEARLAEPDGPPITPLLDADRPAVLALTALVYPHYFRPRTMELGRYLGIVDHGRLAAMVGERLAMPGLRELSAVCTHPDHLGRGLARRLLARACNDVLDAGATPFLHVSPDNTRARELYERNGFRTRVAIPFWSLRRAPRAGTEARW